MDKQSVEYLNEHPDVLLGDDTYKTNKFGMPCWHVIGIDGQNQAFTVQLCFLDNETEENYDFPIRHLASHFKPGIFPSVFALDADPQLIAAVEKHFPPIRTKIVICYWHVSKNVLTNCKAKFETEERWEEFLKMFRDVVYAKTEEEFEDLLAEWKTEFNWNDGNIHRASANSTAQDVQQVAERELERSALVYTIGQWLTTHKRRLVHAWVDQFFNFGLTVTSRLEGAHRIVKLWIGSSTKDLGRAWDAIKLMIKDQLNERRQKMARQLSTTPANLTASIFHPLLGKITHHCLYLFHAQYTLAKREEQRQQAGEEITDCSGTYYRSMGIPCWHMIKERLLTNSVFQPVDFHPHYHYERPPPGAAPFDPPRPILDPHTRDRRRQEAATRRAHERAHARLRTAQTGRILSQFEQLQRRLTHCSACTPRGHDKATCTGCSSTGHTRSRCPFREAEIPLMPATQPQPRLQPDSQPNQPRLMPGPSRPLSSQIAQHPLIPSSQQPTTSRTTATQFDDRIRDRVPATQYPPSQAFEQDRITWEFNER